MLIKKLVTLKALLGYFQILKVLVNSYLCSLFYGLTYFQWILSLFGYLRIAFLAEVKWIQLNMFPAHKLWLEYTDFGEEYLLFGLLWNASLFRAEVATSCLCSNCVYTLMGTPHSTQNLWAILKLKLVVVSVRKSILLDP